MLLSSSVLEPFARLTPVIHKSLVTVTIPTTASINVICQLRLCNIYLLYTSSTAQGGGGSFKNRKPIGEAGGCESGMAKRIH